MEDHPELYAGWWHKLTGTSPLPTWDVNLIAHVAQDFLAIVVESAALYTSAFPLRPKPRSLMQDHHRSTIIWYTVAHQLNSNYQFPAIGALPPVVGIANSLIHVRVALGRTIEQLSGSGSKTGSSVVSAPIRFTNLQPRSDLSTTENGTFGQKTVV
jgi:hypothetical protein